MRGIPVALVVGVLLAACGGTETDLSELPTAPVPLPTAVPPDQVGEATWAVPFTYDFGEDFWPLGPHRYGYRISCPPLQTVMAGEWRDFDVTTTVQLLETPVYLRLGGLSTDVLAPINILQIHPDQATIAVVTIIGVTEEQAQLAAAAPECEVVIAYDQLRFESLAAGQPYQP